MLFLRCESGNRRTVIEFPLGGKVRSNGVIRGIQWHAVLPAQFQQFSRGIQTWRPSPVFPGRHRLRRHSARLRNALLAQVTLAAEPRQPVRPVRPIIHISFLPCHIWETFRAFTEEEKKAALVELREMVASGAEDPIFRADLANVLTTIDDSDAAVQAVAPLLQEADPPTVLKAIVALTHTTNPQAIQAAYAFVQNDEELLRKNPQALLAALGPLATTDNDVTPMLNRIIQQTDDFTLYAGAVQCLIHAKPTPAILESIAQAHAAVQRFPQYAAQAEQMCRTAARKHARFFQQNRARYDATTVKSIESLIKEGDAA